MVRRAEFVKRKAGHFHHAVVERRLKAGSRLSGDRVFDLVQTIAQRGLRRNPGDGIPRRLGSEGRGPRHSRIDLYDDILKALRIQGELHVAAADDLELRYNVQSSTSKHLVLPV